MTIEYFCYVCRPCPDPLMVLEFFSITMGKNSQLNVDQTACLLKFSTALREIAGCKSYFCSQ